MKKGREDQIVSSLQKMKGQDGHALFLTSLSKLKGRDDQVLVTEAEGSRCPGFCCQLMEAEGSR